MQRRRRRRIPTLTKQNWTKRIVWNPKFPSRIFAIGIQTFVSQSGHNITELHSISYAKVGRKKKKNRQRNNWIQYGVFMWIKWNERDTRYGCAWIIIKYSMWNVVFLFVFGFLFHGYSFGHSNINIAGFDQFRPVLALWWSCNLHEWIDRQIELLANAQIDFTSFDRLSHPRMNSFFFFFFVLLFPLLL